MYIKKTHKVDKRRLTKIDKLRDSLLPPEGGAAALVVENNQDVQQGLHTVIHQSHTHISPLSAYVI